jgi:hypothetical protein
MAWPPKPGTPQWQAYKARSADLAAARNQWNVGYGMAKSAADQAQTNIANEQQRQMALNPWSRTLGAVNSNAVDRGIWRSSMAPEMQTRARQGYDQQYVTPYQQQSGQVANQLAAYGQTQGPQIAAWASELGRARTAADRQYTLARMGLLMGQQMGEQSFLNPPTYNRLQWPSYFQGTPVGDPKSGDSVSAQWNKPVTATGGTGKKAQLDLQNAQLAQTAAYQNAVLKEQALMHDPKYLTMLANLQATAQANAEHQKALALFGQSVASQMPTMLSTWAAHPDQQTALLSTLQGQGAGMGLTPAEIAARLGGTATPLGKSYANFSAGTGGWAPWSGAASGGQPAPVSVGGQAFAPTAWMSDADKQAYLANAADNSWLGHTPVGSWINANIGLPVAATTTNALHALGWGLTGR